jgi:O-antigen ligase
VEASGHPIAGRGLAPGDELLKRGAAALALILLAAALALALYRSPPPSLGLLLVGGIAATSVLALAVARLEAAVALGFLLLGVVKIEPAPPDFVFACVIAIAAVTGRFDLARVQPVAAAAVAVFLALNVLSLVEVIDPVRAAFFVTITLYLAVFSLWFAGYLDSFRKARGVVIAYIAIAAISAAAGLLSLVGGVASDLLLFHGDRIEALFKDPNVFAPFLVPPALILLEETLQPRLLSMRRPIKASLFALLAIGVVLSFSRASWLNLALGIAVVIVITALRRGGSRRALALLATALVGCVVALGAITATGSEEFASQRATVQSYDVARFDAQREGLELALKHPTGIGPGQFDVVSPVAAHSAYIRVLTEQGLLGLASFLALALVTLLLAARNATLGRTTHGIGTGALLGAWCGLLVNSFFVDTLHWRHLWVVAALIWVGAMRRPVDSDGLAGTP